MMGHCLSIRKPRRVKHDAAILSDKRSVRRWPARRQPGADELGRRSVAGVVGLQGTQYGLSLCWPEVTPCAGGRRSGIHRRVPKFYLNVGKPRPAMLARRLPSAGW